MEVIKIEVEMEVIKMEVKMEVQMEVEMEVEKDLNRMELDQMELDYKLDEIFGWKESYYDKEDYELDLSNFGCD